MSVPPPQKISSCATDVCNPSAVVYGFDYIMWLYQRNVYVLLLVHFFKLCFQLAITFNKAEDVRAAFVDSLKMLQLKYIDLYLIHFPCGFCKEVLHLF